MPHADCKLHKYSSSEQLDNHIFLVINAASWWHYFSMRDVKHFHPLACILVLKPFISMHIIKKNLCFGDISISICFPFTFLSRFTDSILISTCT